MKRFPMTLLAPCVGVLVSLSAAAAAGVNEKPEGSPGRGHCEDLNAPGTCAERGALALGAAPIPPDEVVKTTTARLQATIHERQKEFRADPKKLYAFVDEVVVPRFDLKYIAQLILARHWKGATEDQRARFQVAFKKMLVHTYADALVEYNDSVKADWQPLRMAPDAKDVTVQSKLLRQSKPPVPIGFAMRLSGDEWKVYDIVIENLSLVTNFRSQISSEVKKSGLDAVIQKLEGGKPIAPETGKSG